MNRADLFAYVALVAAWVVIAAWVYRIGKKANRLQASIDAAGPAPQASRDAF